MLARCVFLNAARVSNVQPLVECIVGDISGAVGFSHPLLEGLVSSIMIDATEATKITVMFGYNINFSGLIFL